MPCKTPMLKFAQAPNQVALAGSWPSTSLPFVMDQWLTHTLLGGLLRPNFATSNFFHIFMLQWTQGLEKNGCEKVGKKYDF